MVMALRASQTAGSVAAPGAGQHQQLQALQVRVRRAWLQVAAQLAQNYVAHSPVTGSQVSPRSGDPGPQGRFQSLIVVDAKASIPMANQNCTSLVRLWGVDGPFRAGPASGHQGSWGRLLAASEAPVVVGHRPRGMATSAHGKTA